MTTHIIRVERNFAPSAGGFHFIRLTVTYEDATGEQSYNPPDEFAVRDAVGVWQTDPVYGSDEGIPEGCYDDTGHSGVQKLAPGATAGPFGVCFRVAGDAAAPLLVAWKPRSSTMGGCATAGLIPASLTSTGSGILFSGTINVEAFGVSRPCSDVLLPLP